MTLEFHACSYAYRRWQHPIIEDFSFRLMPGLTVLLGPNGAGKSTLLKLGASVFLPKSGKVTLSGVRSGRKAYRRDVAWMPQSITPMPSLTAREYIAYVGWLKGMSRTDAWDQSGHALARVELTKKANVRTSQLSGGQLRRVGVAAALVHEARVLLLDEPTVGMDPHQRRTFRDVLMTLTDEVSILMSTHDVADLAEDANHVAVLSEGEMIHNGPTDAFFAHTPYGTAPGRAAEGAYTALLREHEVL